MRIALGVAVALGLGSIVVADPSHAAIRLPTNIPAQSLGPALKDFAESRDLQILYFTDTVRNLKTSGAVGEVTTDEALTSILQGTGLTYKYLDDKTITILTENSRENARHPAPAGRGAATTASPSQETDSSSDTRGGKSFWGRFRVAQADQERTSSTASTLEAHNDSFRQNESQPARLEEIVVTATKRSERVQDIPLSITVIGNQDIERRGLIGMQDYLRAIPGVNQIDNGPLSNAIVIRGITTSPEFENGSSGVTVATYFDETPITGAAGLGAGGIDVRPVDVERIEVLRGPQGTAYGSASLGGAVRIIPVKPQLDSLGGKVAASYSDTSGLGGDNTMAQGVLNVPVVPGRFALRFVGYRYDESGYYRNVGGTDPVLLDSAQTYGLRDYVAGPVQDDIGEMESRGGRASALWRATDDFDLSLNFLTQNIEQNGWPVAQFDTFDQSHGPIAEQGRVRGERGEVFDTKMRLANVVLNYNLGWATLTSALSWVDGGSADANGATRTSSAVLGPYSSTGRSDFESKTAEMRLVSHLNGKFQFLGGVFYEDVDNDLLFVSDWPGTPATSPVGTYPMYYTNSQRELAQRAAFGEVSYDLTSQLELTIGGRYFDYDRSERNLTEGGFVRIPIGAGPVQNLSSSENRSVFKANLSYKPVQDALVYASWAQGFRLGRPDIGALPALCDTNADGVVDGTGSTIESTRTIDSDFLDNYEVGTKLALLDRRLIVDGAVYYITWQGLPVRTAVNTLCGYTANAGAATSKGMELQASVFVTRGLRLDFGAAYTKAELSKDAPAQGWRAGDRLPGSPKLNANLAAQYDFAVADYNFFVRADSFYAGKFYRDFKQTPGLDAGDYVKVDARLGVTIRNLSVEIFGRNLTNEDAFTWRTFDAGPTNPLSGYRMQPRTVGVQLGYSF